MDNFLEINSNYPILHACVIDWGSDYVLKPPKEFDPLSPYGAIAPPLPHGGVEEESVSVVVGVACQVRCTGSVGL